MDFNGDSANKLIVTASRVYTDIVQNKPSSYSNCDSFTPTMDSIDNYALIRRLGHGKYSTVFEAIYEPLNETVVIKVLKPVRKRKIKREIKILDCLKNGPNIVQLRAVVAIPQIDLSALVFEQFPQNEDFKNVYLKLSEADTRFYMHEVLKALDYCHSHGIMHRDVKPHNIIVDLSRKVLRLIDWGLAEFYQPGQEYNVRVASRYFKGPELLIEYGYYDYSLDMWSVGCMFASMIFRKEPFFHGMDNGDQLMKIIKVLGSHELQTYAKKYHIALKGKVASMLSVPHSKRMWQRFITTENEYLISDQAVNFLELMLRYDHMERITAKEALGHKYFQTKGKSQKKMINTLVK